jgi:hypothetical protein
LDCVTTWYVVVSIGVVSLGGGNTTGLSTTGSEDVEGGLVRVVTGLAEEGGGAEVGGAVGEGSADDFGATEMTAGATEAASVNVATAGLPLSSRTGSGIAFSEV